ncbi:MAG: hypothetical protein ACR2IP_06905 [Solirubrobacteraceae bacterium]
MPSSWLVDLQANSFKRIVPLAWAALAVALCAWPPARAGARPVPSGPLCALANPPRPMSGGVPLSFGIYPGGVGTVNQSAPAAAEDPVRRRAGA